MSSMDDDKSDLHSRVGLRLKVQRKKTNLTLGELAEITGLTASFISQVERGKASVSLNSLHTLAEALGVPIWYFVSMEDEGHAGVHESIESEKSSGNREQDYFPVVQPETRKQLLFPATGVKLELLVPCLGQKMASFKGRLKPGKSHIATRLRESTEEIIYVLAGALRLEFIDASFTIYPDESIYFAGEKLLKMTGVSEDEDTIWISVITPAVF